MPYKFLLHATKFMKDSHKNLICNCWYEEHEDQNFVTNGHYGIRG